MRAWVVCKTDFIGALSGREYTRGSVYHVVSDRDEENPLWYVEGDRKALFTDNSLKAEDRKFRMFDNEFLARAYAATLGGER